MLGELADGPDAVRIGRGEAFEGRAHRLGLDVAQFVVRLVFGEIDAGPAGEKRERRLVIDIPAVFGVLGLRLGLITAANDGRQSEDQEVVRIAAQRSGAAADIGDLRRYDLPARPIY